MILFCLYLDYNNRELAESFVYYLCGPQIITVLPLSQHTECCKKWDLKDCEIVWVDLHIIVFALALAQLLSHTPTYSFSCRVADCSGGLWLKVNHRYTVKHAHVDLLVLLILFAAPLPVRSAEITMHNSHIHKFYSHVTNQSIYYSIRVAQGGSTEMSLSNTIKRFHGTHYGFYGCQNVIKKKKKRISLSSTSHCGKNIKWLFGGFADICIVTFISKPE